MPIEKHVRNVLCDLLGTWKYSRLEKIMFKSWAMIACCSPLQKISSSSSSTTLAKTGAEQCNRFHQSSNIKHEKTRLYTIYTLLSVNLPEMEPVLPRFSCQRYSRLQQPQNAAVAPFRRQMKPALSIKDRM